MGRPQGTTISIRFVFRFGGPKEFQCVYYQLKVGFRFMEAKNSKAAYLPQRLERKFVMKKSLELLFQN